MLSTRLLDLARGLNEYERDNLKLLLGMAAGQLAPSEGDEVAVRDFEAYRTVAGCLARLQPHSERVPANGIAWRGRPSFVDDILLSALQAEAREGRSTALRHDEHFIGCGGPIANELALSAELHHLVRRHAGPVEATGTASYIYYDEPGQNICPHIDTGIFSVNALLMLQHVSPVERRSELQMYPVDRPKESVVLAAGEMVVFWADSVVHGRTSVGSGESVGILTVGFKPIT